VNRRLDQECVEKKQQQHKEEETLNSKREEKPKRLASELKQHKS